MAPRPYIIQLKGMCSGIDSPNTRFSMWRPCDWPSGEAYTIRSERKDGDTMKATAEHHWSGDTLLMMSTVVGLVIGAVGGWILGIGMKNIGLGVTIGATVGLILGLIAGVVVSDKAEE